jgi:hypothetical protein
MQIDSEAKIMSRIMEEDELREQFEQFDPTNEKILTLAPKDQLDKLKADLRKMGYRTQNKYFRK